MRKRLALTSGLLATMWVVSGAAQSQVQSNPSVFRIVVNCALAPSRGRDQKDLLYVLSGFVAEVQGQKGLITALHGVAGCPGISASNDTFAVKTLSVRKVDIDRDAAFLVPRSDTLAAIAPLQLGSSDVIGQGDTLEVYGYANAARRQVPYPLKLNKVARGLLGDFVGGRYSS
jgi:hypothetical protein